MSADMDASELARELNERGFALVRDAVPDADLVTLRGLLLPLLVASAEPRRGPSAYAVRHVFAHSPEVRGLLASTRLPRLARAVLGEGAGEVDATLFDKTPDANWAVPAHQDVVVPSLAAPEVPEPFERHGGLYVDAPDASLHQLVALRLHLDDCPAENGALCVVPGSHRRRLAGEAIAALDRDSFVACPAAAGDVLAMSPLLVHRSSPSRSPQHRRVLHVLYRAAATATRS